MNEWEECLRCVCIIDGYTEHIRRKTINNGELYGHVVDGFSKIYVFKFKQKLYEVIWGRSRRRKTEVYGIGRRAQSINTNIKTCHQKVTENHVQSPDRRLRPAWQSWPPLRLETIQIFDGWWISRALPMPIDWSPTIDSAAHTIYCPVAHRPSGCTAATTGWRRHHRHPHHGCGRRPSGHRYWSLTQRRHPHCRRRTRAVTDGRNDFPDDAFGIQWFTQNSNHHHKLITNAHIAFSLSFCANEHSRPMRTGHTLHDVLAQRRLAFNYTGDGDQRVCYFCILQTIRCIFSTFIHTFPCIQHASTPKPPIAHIHKILDKVALKPDSS